MHEIFNSLQNVLDSNPQGYLAIFDFADFKRRNAHLGYRVGDEDILEFESILKSLLTSEESFLRIAGDKWLIFVPTNYLHLLNSIIEGFHSKTKVLVGWEGSAIFQEKKLTSKTTIETFISRSVRCAYKSNDIHLNVEEQSEELFSYVEYCDVDTLTKIPVVKKRSKWKCVDYPEDERSCLNCGGISFEYQGDGSESILDMDGKCNNCGAINSYREIFEIVN